MARKNGEPARECLKFEEKLDNVFENYTNSLEMKQ